MCVMCRFNGEGGYAHQDPPSDWLHLDQLCFCIIYCGVRSRGRPPLLSDALRKGKRKDVGRKSVKFSDKTSAPGLASHQGAGDIIQDTRVHYNTPRIAANLYLSCTKPLSVSTRCIIFVSAVGFILLVLLKSVHAKLENP